MELTFDTSTHRRHRRCNAANVYISIYIRRSIAINFSARRPVLCVHVTVELFCGVMLLLRGACRKASRLTQPWSRFLTTAPVDAALRRSVDTFTVPSFTLQSGYVLRDVRLVYASYGDPRAPLILHPTSFDAKHEELEYAVGPGRALDTRRYRVVVPNMLGNGLSSSPSTHATRGAFPLVTVADNVQLQARSLFAAPLSSGFPYVLTLTRTLSSRQRRLLSHLNVCSVELVYGYSMGAMQALHWAALYPGVVKRVLASCGRASCGEYGAVFLEGLLAVLTSGCDFGAHEDGFLEEGPRLCKQLAAFGRVYAGWGLPAEWYRAQLWRQHGAHASLEDFLQRSWEAWTANADANDLRAMLRTWRAASLAHAAACSESQALGSITARVVYMSSPGDCYFPLEEIEAEAKLIPDARVVPLTREWGHRAGDPYRSGQENDRELMRHTVQELLQT